MALINCPECNHEISDTAKTCPNCGYSLKKGVEIKSLTIPKLSKKSLYVIISLIVITIIGISAFWFAKNSLSDEEKFIVEKLQKNLKEGLDDLKVTEVLHIKSKKKEGTDCYYITLDGTEYGYDSDLQVTYSVKTSEWTSMEEHDPYSAELNESYIAYQFVQSMGEDSVKSFKKNYDVSELDVNKINKKLFD